MGATGGHETRWYEEPDASAIARARELAQTLELHPVLAQVLISRGVETEEEARRFLEPRLADLVPPGRMADFDRAIELAAAAVDDRRCVGVFGDYDVDGITSAAVVVSYLGALGVPTRVRIAHRSRGYGLRPEDVEVLRGQGAELLMACDVGSSDVEAVALARQRGLEVVVLDHHNVPDVLPPASALVNPGRPGCGFPDAGMASVGLSFYLAAGLRTHFERRAGRPEPPDPRSLLDLAALGTVADVAPLRGLNRILVATGLRVLDMWRRPGLRALAQVSGLLDRSEPVSVRDVAFRLAPRLNAAGRMGDATPAFELLMEQDAGRAAELALHLDGLNRKRQQLQDQVFEAARQQVFAGLAPIYLLVVDGAGWHPGVVGIVASKLVEAYRRPAVVIALDEDGTGRGSARTFGDLNLYRCLEKASEVLDSFGGHEAAAGLEVRRERIVRLRRLLNEAIAEELRKLPPPAVWNVDARVDLSAVDEELVSALDSLGPTGAGNPDPVLMVRGVRVEQRRIVGNGHLKVVLSDATTGSCRDGIGFSMASQAPSLGENVDVIFVADRNHYRGVTTVQLRILDIRPAEPVQAPNAVNPECGSGADVLRRSPK